MKNSYVTVTDQFCGAGGSSLGAVAGGAEVKMAMNHWRLAIETHNHNFPDTAHDCTDISACDPRRYPSTDILITSPECTNHSLAKGVKRPNGQDSFFDGALPDAAAERSRATMWDVPRFAEYHRYNIIVVENVPDARHWVMWDAWLLAMQLLGYEHQVVYLNSMFALPTPQSRDRMYVVFHRKGNPAPDLNFYPPAWCDACQTTIDAVQSWKNPLKKWGKYRQQYLYRCPTCAAEVMPFYYAAFNAIDWSIKADRIGDRKRPLTEKTLARIRYGLEKFAGRGMLVSTNYFRPNVPLDQPHPTQTTGGQHGVMVPPFLVDFVHTGHTPSKVRSTIDAAMRTQLGIPTEGLIIPPMMIPMGYSHEQHDRRSYPIDAPMPTQSTRQELGLTVPPFMVELRNNSWVRGVADPLSTFCAGGGHHGLITPPPFLTSYYSTDTGHGLDEPMGTLSTMDRHGMVVPPFLVSYYGERHGTHGLEEALPTVPGMALHYIAQPGEVPDVDDCGFRMLQPHEVGAAMAFPDTYVVKGNQRQKIKQYGNAVTPPAMRMLMERCLDTLN